MANVGVELFNYLLDILKTFHGVQFNMAGNKFVGINIKWDYAACCCHISMLGYISTLLLKFNHPQPTKPWISPFKCLPISYCTKSQLTPDQDTSVLLDDSHKHCIQNIVGVLLYYPRVVDNKFLVALSC